jgi:predicted nuclease with TOPRIM domain
MMDEQGTHSAVLVEDMRRQLQAVAESNRAVAEALADMKHDFGRRFDELDVKFVGMTIEMHDLKAEVGTLGGKVDKLEVAVDKLEVAVDKLEGKVDKLEGKVDKLEAFASDAGPRLVRLEGKVDKLEAFATDAAPRLVRIETHLALPAPRPRRETARRGPSKHHRRKPAKRN